MCIVKKKESTRKNTNTSNISSYTWKKNINNILHSSFSSFHVAGHVNLHDCMDPCLYAVFAVFWIFNKNCMSWSFFFLLMSEGTITGMINISFPSDLTRSKEAGLH